MRTRFLIFVVVFTVVGLLVDLYVWRRWRRFAGPRPRLRWTLRPLLVLAWTMPFVMPAFALTSRWWEGGAMRGLVVGLWAFHYVPRFVIALWLAVVDAVRGLGWIGRRLAGRGSVTEAADVMDARRDAPDGASLPHADAVVAPVAGTYATPTLAPAPMSRREMLRTAGWAAAAVPFVVVGRGLASTVYDFDVRRLDVPIAGLPRALDGLRITQLSDLHAGSYPSSRPFRDAVDLALGERADLVVVTGDFVNRDAAELAVVSRDLARLRADLGVMGCLGNHDHYGDEAAIQAGIRAAGVDLLVNDARTLRIGGEALHIVGTDNTGFRQHHADLPRALAALPPRADDGAPRVLLAHDPTFWDLEARDAGLDLQLSGHTHGGQIGLEAPDALRWSLAQLSYERWAGLYTERGDRGMAHVYVNRGLGTTGPPLRLGIRPEVTVLTLRRA